MTEPERSLDVQRREFASRRFLAMPLAGTIAWLVVAAGGRLRQPVLSHRGDVAARLRHRHPVFPRRPLVAPSSLPLSVGILRGLMWLPVSWLLQHWIGIFHAATRTVLLVAAHYLFQQHRYIVIPLVIVAIYAVTILVLERRWRSAS